MAAAYQTMSIYSIFHYFPAVKLDGKNYWTWRSSVLPIIRAFDSECFILGTLPCPPKYLPQNPPVVAPAANGPVAAAAPAANGPMAPAAPVANGRMVLAYPGHVNPAFLFWRRQDKLLVSWLQSTLQQEVLIFAVGMWTSRDLWHNLERIFSQQSITWMSILRDEINPPLLPPQRNS